MTETTDYQNGVIAVTSLARVINPEIGAYLENPVKLTT